MEYKFLTCEKQRWPLEGVRKPIGVSTYTDNLIRKVEKHLEVLTRSIRDRP